MGEQTRVGEAEMVAEEVHVDGVPMIEIEV